FIWFLSIDLTTSDLDYTPRRLASQTSKPRVIPQQIRARDEIALVGVCSHAQVPAVRCCGQSARRMRFLSPDALFAARPIGLSESAFPLHENVFLVITDRSCPFDRLRAKL